MLVNIIYIKDDKKDKNQEKKKKNIKVIWIKIKKKVEKKF